MIEVKLVSNLSVCFNAAGNLLQFSAPIFDLKRQMINYTLGVADTKSEGKRGIASAKGKSRPRFPHSPFLFRGCHAVYQCKGFSWMLISRVAFLYRLYAIL